MIKFRVGDLAKAVGVHRNTVTYWLKTGKLQAQPTVGKQYLIEEAELRRLCSQYQLPETLLLEAAAPLAGELKLPADRPFPSPTREVPMSTTPVGSVLVVGGGIAGIQAALDLADSGYFVHLVEKSAGIGGVMSQLDKTFPTNDCAM